MYSQQKITNTKHDTSPCFKHDLCELLCMEIVPDTLLIIADGLAGLYLASPKNLLSNQAS
jgi:hypothetical protein